MNKKSDTSMEFEGQLPGEEVMLMFRKHPVTTRRGLIYASLAVLVGPIVTTLMTYNYDYQWIDVSTPPSFGFFMLMLLASVVLGLIMYFPYWMSWYFSVYVITNMRYIYIHQKGFFTKGISDTPLKQIQSLNYMVKGLQETLLGYGTVTIQTYIGDIVIHDTPHPAKITSEISDILIQCGVHPVEYPAHEGEQQGE